MKKKDVFTKEQRKSLEAAFAITAALGQEVIDFGISSIYFSWVYGNQTIYLDHAKKQISIIDEKKGGVFLPVTIYYAIGGIGSAYGYKLQLGYNYPLDDEEPIQTTTG